MIGIPRATIILTSFVILMTVSSAWNISHLGRQGDDTVDAFLSYPRVFDGQVADGLETAIQIRALFYLNLAAYNCWANYHPTAVDIFGRDRFKRPVEEHTLNNKNIALFYAQLRIYEGSPSSFGGPEGIPLLRELMVEEGLDPDDTSTDTTTAVGIGNREGTDTARLMALDNWNQEGMQTSTDSFYALPFSDYSGYIPKNNPWEIEFPFKWQPLLETDGKGVFFRQEHSVPFTGDTLAFSLTPDEVAARTVESPYSNPDANKDQASSSDINKLKNEAKEVFKKSRKLTETQRLFAEYFDNKVSTFRTAENPLGTPGLGTAMRFFVVGAQLGLDFDQDMIYGIAENIATYDALITVWKEKRRQDAIRPTGQTMDMLFAPDKTFKVWGGPNKPNTNIKAREWQSYIHTMPHSEFPSASACICHAVVQQTLEYTNGQDDLPFQTTIAKGASKFYPGEIPNQEETLTIDKISDWDELCGESRLWAGVHFEPAVQAGKDLCDGIGQQSQQVVDSMVAGTPVLKWIDWLPPDTPSFWEEP